MAKYRPVKNMEARQKIRKAIETSPPSGFTVASIKRVLDESGEVVSITSIRREIATMDAQGLVGEKGCFANHTLYGYQKFPSIKKETSPLQSFINEFKRLVDYIEKLEKEVSVGRMAAKRLRISIKGNQGNLPFHS